LQAETNTKLATKKTNPKENSDGKSRRINHITIKPYPEAKIMIVILLSETTRVQYNFSPHCKICKFLM